ncbi:hypothetical protein CWC22_000370 [Pseudoalteromonas rubra]|uniref:Uncharacterized protein n=1 Tax=Pseudoalteromonas rubra TaxID=43658 RepID=A0A5S3UUA1_9GAMM|nr:hypothetical protein [Pseudoalteromonas rubra]QPB81555.1 hypothetical protein CWC22_000370 [Pseudoalteromonas rubra]
MKKSFLNYIKKSVNGVAYIANEKKGPILGFEKSNEDLLKGFQLYKSPRGVSVLYWFFPMIQLHSDKLMGFFGFIPYSGRPERGDLSLISKDKYSEEEIRDVIVETIFLNREVVDKTSTLRELAFLLENKFESNLSSPINAANFSTLCYAIGEREKAKKYISAAYSSSNERHVAHEKICEFYNALTNENWPKADELIEIYKKKNLEVAVKNRLFYWQ